jgi:hypothetical protein
MTAAVAQAAVEAWLAANQQALMAEVASVRAILLSDTAGDKTLPADAGADQPTALDPTALDQVCRCFDLSDFERRLIVLCAGPELDAGFGEVLATVQGSRERAYPTFGLALAAFADAHWSALTPGAPLRRWRLIEPGPGLLTLAPLHIDEWLLHVLTGARGIDQRLDPVITPLTAAEPLPASAERAVCDLTTAWLNPRASAPILLHGCSRQQRRQVFATACARLGWQPYLLNAADLPATAAELGELTRLWVRGAFFDATALLVETAGRDHDQTGARDPVDRLRERLATPWAVAADSISAERGSGTLIEVSRPTAAEQRALWAEALGQEALTGVLDRLTAHFDLDASAIAMAAERALRTDGAADGGDHDGADTERLVWDACRRQARGDLDQLAQRLDSSATFDDLVLPAAQLELIGDIVAHVRQRDRVYREWQMAGTSQRGLGISALFSGPSGTGKTLAAEVVANALDLDLYRIDLSQVVSKWLGETEKNLRQIFEAARDSGAVLLFDEADALFGKRSEVRDSHDRYANVEISYLLQAMETYRGLALLTTNMRGAIDTAFLRRLRFVVTFPFPGAAERARIWRRAFPAATPTSGLDIAKLAQLAVAGGDIRSIALHAAFAAATAGVPVGMAEVLRATVAEYAKLDRPLSDAEIAGWV